MKDLESSNPQRETGNGGDRGPEGGEWELVLNGTELVFQDGEVLQVDDVHGSRERKVLLGHL